MPYIIVLGNLVNGLSFYGPFAHYDDAQAYSETIRDTDWWIAPLNAPDVE